MIYYFFFIAYINSWNRLHTFLFSIIHFISSFFSELNILEVLWPMTVEILWNGTAMLWIASYRKLCTNVIIPYWRCFFQKVRFFNEIWYFLCFLPILATFWLSFSTYGQLLKAMYKCDHPILKVLFPVGKFLDLALFDNFWSFSTILGQSHAAIQSSKLKEGQIQFQLSFWIVLI